MNLYNRIRMFNVEIPIFPVGFVVGNVLNRKVKPTSVNLYILVSALRLHGPLCGKVFSNGRDPIVFGYQPNGSTSPITAEAPSSAPKPTLSPRQRATLGPASHVDSLALTQLLQLLLRPLLPLPESLMTSKTR